MSGTEAGAAAGRPTAAAAAMLALFVKAGGAPAHELGAGAAREVVAASAGSLQGPKPELARVSEHTIPGPGGAIAMRAYHPDPERLPPLLIYLHGGGWVTGDLDVVDGPCRRLALGTGCVVASIAYRLSPETPFPGPLDDVLAAAAWLAEHAAQLGARADRLILAGDSAGANLAAAASLAARDGGGPAISELVLLYPPLAAARGSRFASYAANDPNPVLSAATMAWFWDQYLGDAAASPLACPLLADSLAGLPRTLMVTAELDVLRDEGAEYARRLAAAGVPVQLIDYAGTPHGFFWMDRFLPEAQRVVEDIAAFLKQG